MPILINLIKEHLSRAAQITPCFRFVLSVHCIFFVICFVIRSSEIVCFFFFFGFGYSILYIGRLCVYIDGHFFFIYE